MNPSYYSLVAIILFVVGVFALLFQEDRTLIAWTVGALRVLVCLTWFFAVCFLLASAKP